MSLYVEKVWRTNEQTTDGQMNLCIELRYAQLKNTSKENLPFKLKEYLWFLYSLIQKIWKEIILITPLIFCKFGKLNYRCEKK